MSNLDSNPRISNTGVTDTSSSIFGAFPKILIDWIQVTLYTFDGDIYTLFNYLFNIPKDMILSRAGGFFGYNTTIYYKNICILYNDYRDDMGYHIYVTGGGCRDLEDFGVDYKILFKKINELNCHYTRLDVSIDLFNDNNVTFKNIQNCITNNEVVSHFRFVTSIEKRRLKDNSNIGTTIYFGSRCSLFQLVFYDKYQERVSYGFIPDSSIKSWVRIESRLRDNLAYDTATRIVYSDDFTPVWFSILSYYIDFKIRNNYDKNRSRWNSQKWWLDFLHTTSKIKLSNVNHEHNLVKTRMWLQENVSRSQFVCFVAGLKDLDTDVISSNLFFEMLKSGLSKIDEKDVQLINDFRLKNNLSLFTKKDIEEYFLDLKRVLVTLK